MHWKSHETSANSGDEVHWGWFSTVEVDTDQKQKDYGRIEQGIRLFGCIKLTSQLLKISTGPCSVIAFPMHEVY